MSDLNPRNYDNEHQFAHFMGVHNDAAYRIAQVFDIDDEDGRYPEWFLDAIPDERGVWVEVLGMSDAEIRARFSDLLAQSKAEKEGAI